ncbi:hypothetical protein D3C76_1017310 [compost metagenome]
MTAGHDPFTAIGFQALGTDRALLQPLFEHRMQVLHFGQLSGLRFLDQLAAVRVGHGIIGLVEQHHLGAGCDLVAGKGGAQIDQSQVGTQYNAVAGAACEGSANVAGGKKQIGCSGDLVQLGQCLLEPWTVARIVLLARDIAGVDLVEFAVEQQ